MEADLLQKYQIRRRRGYSVMHCRCFSEGVTWQWAKNGGSQSRRKEESRARNDPLALAMAAATAWEMSTR